MADPRTGIIVQFAVTTPAINSRRPDNHLCILPAFIHLPVCHAVLCALLYSIRRRWRMRVNVMMTVQRSTARPAASLPLTVTPVRGNPGGRASPGYPCGVRPRGAQARFGRPTSRPLLASCPSLLRSHSSNTCISVQFRGSSTHRTFCSSHDDAAPAHPRGCSSCISSR